MVATSSLLSVKVTKKYSDRWKHSLHANYLSIVEIGINHCHYKVQYCIWIPFCNGQKAKIDISLSLFRKKTNLFI